MKNALWAVPKWLANRPQSACAGTSTCCSTGAGSGPGHAADEVDGEDPGIARCVHRVKFAVMCPSAVPISSTRRGLACSQKREHRPRVSCSRVYPHGARRTSGEPNVCLRQLGRADGPEGRSGPKWAIHISLVPESGWPHPIPNLPIPSQSAKLVGGLCLRLNLVSEDLEHTQVISHDNLALGTAHAFARVNAKTGLPNLHQLGASAQRPRWLR